MEKSIIDVLEDWKNQVRVAERPDISQEYYAIELLWYCTKVSSDQQHLESISEEVMMSILFKRELVIPLFIAEISKTGSFAYRRWHYIKSIKFPGFMCLGGGDVSGDIHLKTTRTDQEILEYVRNSFWYIKNK